MKVTDNVTTPSRIAPGVLLGSLGILGFSFTLPATKAAVADLDPVVVGLGRAVVAAVLAAGVLVATRSPVPASRHWAKLGLVSVGVVIGFPLFSTLALHRLSAGHGAIITGLLPAATAVLAVLLAGERPVRAFWWVCLAGLLSVLVFAASQGAGRPQAADGLALLAVLFGAVGYAEGAIVARELGGWPVICWALVIAVPVVVPIAGVAVARAGLHAAPMAWAGFAYVSVVSMFLAFFPWYQGLAVGGVARVSQIQLAQPVLTLVWSFLLLGERVGPATVLAGAAVLTCAAASQRTRVRIRPAPPGRPGLLVGSDWPAPGFVTAPPHRPSAAAPRP
jgi:drug/metabolite transporter (DMT)-like permease